jgi:DNA-directed RNA polymerase specialized sigma24 family protein
MSRGRSYPRTISDESVTSPPRRPQGAGRVISIRDAARNPEQVYLQRERQVKLLRAIRNLNARLRSPLLMHMTKGWRAVRNGSSLNEQYADA